VSRKTALADPRSMQWHDVEADGDVREDKAWRELMGDDGQAERSVRDIVAAELGAILRKFDPHQPRDPHTGKWLDVLPESVAGLDILGAWDKLTDFEKKTFAGSARIGAPNRIGVNIVGDADAGGNMLIVDSGTVADHFKPNAANNFSGDYSVISASQAKALDKALTDAAAAANAGRPFSVVIHGEDAGDIRIDAAGTATDPRITVLAYEWDKAPKTNQEILDAWGGWEPFPPPDREDYDSEAEYKQAVADYPADLAADKAEVEAEVIKKYYDTHGLPDAAHLTPAEVAQMLEEIKRLLVAKPLMPGTATPPGRSLARHSRSRRSTVRSVAAEELTRLAGHDVTPGHDELHHYWTKGEGLAKWVHSAHPWTALYHHLVKHVNPEMAKRMASAWFHEVLGFWPGTPHVGAVPTPKAGRSLLIREIVAAELARMAGFNPLQPRGPDGKWIKGAGSAKKAVKAAVRARMLTPKQAHDMQQGMTADRPWMPHQRKALQDYSANEYLLMNSRLRGVTPRAYDQAITDPDPAATEKRIKDVADSLRPLPEPVRVFRNAYAADGLGLPKSYSRRELVERLRTIVGQTREDKGFTSTSIKRLKDDKFGDVRLDIVVPAGTPGAFIESITAKKHEQELVLGRGMQFEILSLDESGSMPVLKVRVIPT
jgi:hypothetical protein